MKQCREGSRKYTQGVHGNCIIHTGSREVHWNIDEKRHEEEMPVDETRCEGEGGKR